MREGTRGRSRVAAALLAATCLTIAAPAAADDPTWSKAGTLRDALLKIGEGRPIELVLTNGKVYKGKLGAVGSETVLVSEIAGKEFYDALIELDDVSAIELRVRGN